jgi:hypothetical protein
VPFSERALGRRGYSQRRQDCELRAEHQDRNSVQQSLGQSVPDGSLDQLIESKVFFYLRYCDDILVGGERKEDLEILLEEMKTKAEGIGLQVHSFPSAKAVLKETAIDK